MEVIPSGITIDLSPEQSEKAKLPIDVIPKGMFTDLSSGHSLNAISLMNVTRLTVPFIFISEGISKSPDGLLYFEPLSHPKTLQTSFSTSEEYPNLYLFPSAVFTSFPYTICFPIISLRIRHEPLRSKLNNPMLNGRQSFRIPVFNRYMNLTI